MIPGDEVREEPLWLGCAFPMFSFQQVTNWQAIYHDLIIFGARTDNGK